MRYLILKFEQFRYWLVSVRIVDKSTSTTSIQVYPFICSVFSVTSDGLPNIVVSLLGQGAGSRIPKVRNSLTGLRGAMC